jgi:hypothetical protein
MIAIEAHFVRQRQGHQGLTCACQVSNREQTTLLDGDVLDN